jgi:hypothetical protein
VRVGDTVPFEDAGALELDVLGSEVVEETAPLAEDHGDETDLELVEETRRASVVVALLTTSNEARRNRHAPPDCP